jgi:hypothetical protein
MRLLSSLTAAALLAAASFTSPAAAMTPAGLSAAAAPSGQAEPVAQVCREFCRGGYCRERCFWRPNRERSGVRIYEDDRGRSSFGRAFRGRGPGVEFRVGPRRDRGWDRD